MTHFLTEREREAFRSLGWLPAMTDREEVLLSYAYLVVNSCEGKLHPTPLERSLAVNGRAAIAKATGQ
jgi:hypothetical protein